MIRKAKKGIKAIRIISAKAIRPFEEFFKMESSGGILLLIATVAALIWANSPWKPFYDALFGAKFTVGFDGLALSKPLILWINDGLMAIFFLVVGLEIKREIVAGELSSIRKAALPVGAAVGGMVVPALIFTWFNAGSDAISGWGIPMATDIAFALGCISLIGRSVPRNLALFLTALAIVDDIGAVLVIALFYTAHISVKALAAALIVALILFIGCKLKVQKISFYLILGGVLWLAILKSGIHATIAGVILGMLIPVESDSQEASVLHKLEHSLHPWVTYLIMPVFALANAGVEINLGNLAGQLKTPVSLGIILGLFLGKQIGIVGLSYIMVRAKLAVLPRDVHWRHIYGAGILGGIGFTMSLFIASLAFINPDLLSTAKIAIITGSAVSATVGMIFLRLAGRERDSQKAERTQEIRARV
ncbi:Na+/H+ antiporter NhaA [Thermincola potens]|uniref:Na(+)/H(+) antiporter NhaA n=1 Tax=Thermincola potens (strain JR) TaxID=635013 RepID=D5X8R1_THEPJ|nr:Na+/H+ antiporter NhaA [Thermincola potens JR]